MPPLQALNQTLDRANSDVVLIVDDVPDNLSVLHDALDEFQVGKIPYGVLLDGEGVIRSKGLTNTREHLESLLEADKTGFASLQEYIASRRIKKAA